MTEQWECDYCKALYPSPKAAMLCCTERDYTRGSDWLP